MVSGEKNLIIFDLQLTLPPPHPDVEGWISLYFKTYLPKCLTTSEVWCKSSTCKGNSIGILKSHKVIINSSVI